jgi:uracil-DNA glycosylase family 4
MNRTDSDGPIQLLVIGEAGGEEEDKIGTPFVGRSGKLLRKAIEGLELDGEVSYTNVVRCRPPDNKITKQAIEYCKQFAIQDIADITPEYIFLMGNSPLQGILGETGISNWNGSIIKKRFNDIIPYDENNVFDEDAEVTVVPLYHPAYILRNEGAMDEWLEAMLNVFEPSEKSDRYEIVLPKTVEDVLDMQKWLSKCEWISYDIETSSLDAFSEDSMVLMVSFAGNGKAYSVPIEHPETWWDVDNGSPKQSSDWATVCQIVNDILLDHSGKLIGHNIKFDLMFTKTVLGVDVDAGGDSMLVNHLLDSNDKHPGLKRLAGMHLGMYEYERELDDYKREHKEADVGKGGSYAFVPLEILLPYSAMDAEATLRLHEKLYPQLSEAQNRLYHQVIMPVSNVLTRMQCTGIVVDEKMAQRYKFLYETRQLDVYAELLQDKHVKRMVKDRIDEKKWKFNPNSSMQLSELYFERYKLEPIAQTDGGKPSTAGESMKVYEKDYPIIKRVRYYKLLNKMLSTYLNPAATGEWLSDDGRVHTTYNLHGTVTGRLSSSNPNLQNIPTPEKEPGTLLETLPIKNVFTHSYWEDGKSYGKLVSVDYSGMELRIFASLAKCKPMIKIHESGKDFHSCVAIMSMTHRKPDAISMEEIAELDKAVRYRYKWTNWTLLYGGDAYTLHNLYDVPIEEAEETVEMYYEMFPEVLEFGNKCVEFAEDHGYVESPYGRRESLAYINDRDVGRKNADARAAKNMPVQSAASDTLLLALIIIDAKMREAGYKSKLVNTVHDSILLDCPEEEVDEVAKLASWTMENIKSLAPLYFPGISMKWLICPLRADVEIGDFYGSEEKQ